MPAVAAADLVEPEGGVRLVRGDDAPYRGRPGEVVHEPGEPQEEGEAVGEQRPLAGLGDDRGVTGADSMVTSDEFGAARPSHIPGTKGHIWKP